MVERQEKEKIDQRLDLPPSSSSMVRDWASPELTNEARCGGRGPRYVGAVPATAAAAVAAAGSRDQFLIYFNYVSIN